MDENNQPPPVTFEDEKFQRPAASSQSETSKIIQLVIQGSGGFVKDEKQANQMLIGFVAIVAIFALVLVFSSGGNDAKFEAPSGQEIIYPENAPPRLERKF